MNMDHDRGGIGSIGAARLKGEKRARVRALTVESDVTEGTFMAQDWSVYNT
jgi:hypothetical protein